MVEFVSFRHRVQTESGAHPSPIQWVPGGSYLGGKVAGAWSWPLSSI